jgi:hypothetical protein
VKINVFDVPRHLRADVHLDRLRLEHVPRGQVAHAVRDRRREEDRLPAHRCLAQDRVDVVDEAHVEHPVRLVQHEVAQSAQREPGGSDEVEQPPRCADDDVTAGGQLLLLLAAGGAAVGQHGSHAHVTAEAVRLAGHLYGQLTRRTDDQRLGVGTGLVEALEDRQQKGQRLARAGLGDSDQVPAVEQDRDRLLLDRRRRVVAGVVQRSP